MIYSDYDKRYDMEDYYWRITPNSLCYEVMKLRPPVKPEGTFKDALDTILGFIRNSNKYFNTEQPWTTRTTDAAACGNTLYQCVQIITNLAVLLFPFLPFSSKKVCSWLNITNRWEKHFVPSGTPRSFVCLWQYALLCWKFIYAHKPNQLFHYRFVFYIISVLFHLLHFQKAEYPFPKSLESLRYNIYQLNSQ